MSFNRVTNTNLRLSLCVFFYFTHRRFSSLFCKLEKLGFENTDECPVKTCSRRDRKVSCHRLFYVEEKNTGREESKKRKTLLFLIFQLPRYVRSVPRNWNMDVIQTFFSFSQIDQSVSVTRSDRDGVPRTVDETSAEEGSRTQKGHTKVDVLPVVTSWVSPNGLFSWGCTFCRPHWGGLYTHSLLPVVIRLGGSCTEMEESGRRNFLEGVG